MIREYLDECHDYIICHPFGPLVFMLGCINGSISVAVLVLNDLVSGTIVTEVIISSVLLQVLLSTMFFIAGLINYTRTYSFRRL